jgi:tRNA pseudouridine55 synthase
MNGILFVDKPAGVTSHDVIDDIRKRSKIRRVGHAGTLDPIATGLLIVAVGRATRALEFFEQLDKQYEVKVRLGQQTDTLDRAGKIVKETSCDHVTPDLLDEALGKFRGKISQQVPEFSAVRVQGKKLYERVRSGEKVTPPSREVEIHSLDRLDFELPFFFIRVSCSKGCYVRALARDIAAALDTCALCEEVRRTKIGTIDIEKAAVLEDLGEGEELARKLTPIDQALSFLPEVRLGLEHQGRFLHGQVLDLRPSGKLMRIYGPDGFLGIGASSWDRYIKPRKVLRD